ncbi:MAG: hypothetical protein R2873_06000 [Caldilineaceae bacterium]|nr:hypothetical protein [Caldilineaceae bacterium]
MHNGVAWVAKRGFDYYFTIWYFAHPFVSAILGSAVAYLFFSGAVIVSGLDNTDTQTISEYPLGLYATIFLTALAAGFSAKYIWQRIDSFVREQLGMNKASEQFHSELSESMRKDIGQLSEAQ